MPQFIPVDHNPFVEMEAAPYSSELSQPGYFPNINNKMWWDFEDIARGAPNKRAPENQLWQDLEDKQLEELRPEDNASLLQFERGPTKLNEQNLLYNRNLDRRMEEIRNRNSGGGGGVDDSGSFGLTDVPQPKFIPVDHDPFTLKNLKGEIVEPEINAAMATGGPGGVGRLGLYARGGMKVPELAKDFVQKVQDMRAAGYSLTEIQKALGGVDKHQVVKALQNAPAKAAETPAASVAAPQPVTPGAKPTLPKLQFMERPMLEDPSPSIEKLLK